MTLKYVLCLLMFPSVSLAQEQDPPSEYAVILGIGMLPNFLLNEYDFESGPFVRSRRNTMVSVVIGASYSPIHVIDKTKLAVSLELLYGHTSTPSTRLSSQAYVRLNQDLFFLALWNKLFAPSTLSPYVRIGVGLFRHHLAEIVTPSLGYGGYVESATRFGIGAGGGLDYKMHPITVSIEFDAISSPGEIVYTYSIFTLRSSYSF